MRFRIETAQRLDHLMRIHSKTMKQADILKLLQDEVSVEVNGVRRTPSPNTLIKWRNTLLFARKQGITREKAFQDKSSTPEGNSRAPNVKEVAYIKAQQVMMGDTLMPPPKPYKMARMIQKLLFDVFGTKRSRQSIAAVLKRKMTAKESREMAISTASYLEDKYRGKDLRLLFVAMKPAFALNVIRWSGEHPKFTGGA